MDDTISRAAAVSEIESIVDTMSVCMSMDECKGMRRMKKTVLERIKELPSAQPGWIPCSTALPEHDGEYLVTIKAFTIDQAVYADIDIARYTGGKWRKGFPVTAWQPLPTPYREGGQE